MNTHIDELNSIISQAIDEIEELKKQMFGRHEKTDLIRHHIEGLQMVKNDAVVELLRLRLDKVKEDIEASEDEQQGDD